MKIAGTVKNVCKKTLPAASAIFFLFAGVALASSGGGHEAAPKGWVVTDTYKVINFLVLVGALFLHC